MRFRIADTSTDSLTHPHPPASRGVDTGFSGAYGSAADRIL